MAAHQRLCGATLAGAAAALMDASLGVALIVGGLGAGAAWPNMLLRRKATVRAAYAATIRLWLSLAGAAAEESWLRDV